MDDSEIAAAVMLVASEAYVVTSGMIDAVKAARARTLETEGRLMAEAVKAVKAAAAQPKRQAPQPHGTASEACAMKMLLAAFAALLIAALVALLLDRRLSDKRRAEMGKARVIRAQIAADLIDFTVAYVLLRGPLSVL